MASTIESVDKLAKPSPRNKVDPAEKSSPEHRRGKFKKALEKELEQDEDKQKNDQQKDAVVIKQDEKDRATHDTNNQETAQPEPVEPETSSTRKQERDPNDHIDLKA